METLIKSTNLKVKDTNQVKTQSLFWNNIEFNRFGIIPIILLIIGCIGGIAAAYGAQSDLVKLSMIAFPTIIALAMVLAVAPMRVIVFVSAIALLLDILVFVF
jgi:hypothetical protein